MLIWGLTWLHPVLKNWYFVIYWLVCFFLTGLAMVIALLDIRAIRKEIREDEKKLVNHIFQDVAPRNKNTRKTYSDSNGKNQTK